MAQLFTKAGRVLFDGQDITGLPPYHVLRLGLAYVPQGRIVFSQMTVIENLEMGAYIERDKAGTMSGGEQQMVAIGRALMTRPKLILLDKPSLGLSPKFVTLIFDKLAVADRGYVLELGRNRFAGTGQAVLSDPEVKRLSLGG